MEKFNNELNELCQIIEKQKLNQYEINMIENLIDDISMLTNKVVDIKYCIKNGVEQKNVNDKINKIVKALSPLMLLGLITIQDS